MLNRVFSEIGKLIKKQASDSPQVSLATKDGRQSCHHDPQDLKEIERLRNELAAVELELGRLIVGRERRWEKSRFLTIAKRHLLTAKTKTQHKWVIESKGLIRYFNCAKENDSEIAIEMLLPVAERYRQARAVD
jgi:hypothetical protein